MNHVAYIQKVKGKGYCVKSEKNPDWSGGCYETKAEAEKRLQQVEMFKSLKRKGKKRKSSFDFIKMAARVALSSKIRFEGHIRSEYDGENVSGEGSITVDGVKHQVVFSAAGVESQYTIDGEELVDKGLATELDDFFSDKWPDLDDDVWQEVPDQEYGDPKTAYVVFV